MFPDDIGTAYIQNTPTSTSALTIVYHTTTTNTGLIQGINQSSSQLTLPTTFTLTHTGSAGEEFWWFFYPESQLNTIRNASWSSLNAAGVAIGGATYAQTAYPAGSAVGEHLNLGFDGTLQGFVGFAWSVGVGQTQRFGR